MTTRQSSKFEPFLSQSLCNSYEVVQTKNNKFVLDYLKDGGGDLTKLSIIDLLSPFRFFEVRLYFLHSSLATPVTKEVTQLAEKEVTK